MIERLAVVGVGLLGGSVALGTRARGLAAEIVGVGRDRGRLDGAARAGVIDRAALDVATGVHDADLIVLAAPVPTIERLLPEVWAGARPGAVITDVGSTKATIVRAAGRLPGAGGPCFVGSHPMAGSERSGWEAARADLFHGATVIVTPDAGSAPEAVKRVAALWERLGAGQVVTMSADAHDRAVAAVSHLPHLVACALMACVERLEPGATAVAGRGFRDTTRIAAGDPEVWRGIFLDNREAVLASVARFRQSLDELAGLVAAGDGPALEAELGRIRAQREALG